MVDGYENILTPESLETLTPRTLAALEPDESLRSNRVGKLVLGDTWYYVTALEESEAQTLQESGRLKLRFAKGVGRDLSVKLTHISEAEGGRVVAVFQGDTYLSELTLLRQQSCRGYSADHHGPSECPRRPCGCGSERLRTRTGTSPW